MAFQKQNVNGDACTLPTDDGRLQAEMQLPSAVEKELLFAQSREQERLEMLADRLVCDVRYNVARKGVD